MQVLDTTITRHNASALKRVWLDAAKTGDTTLDLSIVQVVDSSAVSLVLSWVREHEKAGRVPCIRKAPKKMRELAALYGVDAMLSDYWSD